MEVYYILSILLVVVAFACRKHNKQQSFLLFGLLLLVIGFRHQSMGYDLYWKYQGGYLAWFDTISRCDFDEILKYTLLTGYDVGFVLLNRIIGFFSHERQVYLFVCAFISIMPFAYFTSRESKIPLLSIAIFIGLPTFLYLYGTLRQSVATGVLVLALPYLEKRDKKFFILLAISFLLHAASALFIISYFVYRFNFKLFGKMMTLLVIIVVFISRTVLLERILPYITVGDYGIDKSSSILSFVIFTMIYLWLILFVYDRSSSRIKGYINLFFISCLCLAFQDITPVAARVASFFMFPLMIIIPDYLYRIKVKFLSKLSVSLCFLIFLGYGLYRIDAGGSDFAQSSPYHWFWEDL